MGSRVHFQESLLESCSLMDLMETLLPLPYHSSCSGVEILSTPETYCFHGQLCWQSRRLPATPVSLLSSLLNRTLSGVGQIPGTVFTCTVALWCVTLASSCTGLLSQKRPMLGLMVCCCCYCLEILNNLIFELSFVCEACWGDGARASAEETHWVAAYAHVGSGMREVCTLSIGLDAQCPWPHLGTVLGTVKFPGGSRAGTWAQIGGGDGNSDSKRSSSCDGSGRSLGEGEGCIWSRAGITVGNQAVCAFLQHLYKYLYSESN